MHAYAQLLCEPRLVVPLAKKPSSGRLHASRSHHRIPVSLKCFFKDANMDLLVGSHMIPA